MFAPGFFVSAPVQTALIIGGGAAIVCAVVGVFTIIRGHAFAGHALADVSSAGGAAAFLLGVNPLLGFAAMALLGAGGIELIGTEFIGNARARERSLATGIILGAGLGLAALFLYLDVTSRSTSGAAVTVMFGSMFAIPASVMPLALTTGFGALSLTLLCYRPLLLSALNPELARIRGINTRLVGFVHLGVLALAVSLAAMTVGAILSTALLIGPAATALRLTTRPGFSFLLAAVIGLASCWAGILLAYDSYGWAGGRGWPVSFCIVAIIFVSYLAAAYLPRRAAATA